ncbi:hypothetical protein Tco_0801589 [Tanacetum coccineum]|uniref:Uncharacterized protein n=1 Tax=Tanacetum coccineum TaxID=301880 RepID=A0ABQ4ZZ54_9ASTR
MEQVKPMKKLKHMRLDEELAFKLQAKEEEEEERLAREKAQQIEEANIAWDDVLYAKQDYLDEFLEAKKKTFWHAKRSRKRRGTDPPIRAQQRNNSCDFDPENMEGNGSPNSKKAEIELEENLKKAGAESDEDMLNKKLQLSMKKLEILKKNIKFDLRVTAAQVCVTAAKLKVMDCSLMDVVVFDLVVDVIVVVC